MRLNKTTLLFGIIILLLIANSAILGVMVQRQQLQSEAIGQLQVFTAVSEAAALDLDDRLLIQETLLQNLQEDYLHQIDALREENELLKKKLP